MGIFLQFFDHNRVLSRILSNLQEVDCDSRFKFTLLMYSHFETNFHNFQSTFRILTGHSMSVSNKFMGRIPLSQTLSGNDKYVAIKVSKLKDITHIAVVFEL